MGGFATSTAATALAIFSKGDKEVDQTKMLLVTGPVRSLRKQAATLATTLLLTYEEGTVDNVAVFLNDADGKPAESHFFYAELEA